MPRPSGKSLRSWRHSQFVTPESAQGRFLGEILGRLAGIRKTQVPFGGISFRSQRRRRPRNQERGEQERHLPVRPWPGSSPRSPSHPVEKRFASSGISVVVNGSHVVTDSGFTGGIDDAVRKLGHEYAGFDSHMLSGRANGWLPKFIQAVECVRNQRCHPSPTLAFWLQGQNGPG